MLLHPLPRKYAQSQLSVWMEGRERWEMPGENPLWITISHSPRGVVISSCHVPFMDTLCIQIGPCASRLDHMRTVNKCDNLLHNVHTIAGRTITIWLNVSSLSLAVPMLENSYNSDIISKFPTAVRNPTLTQSPILFLFSLFSNLGSSVVVQSTNEASGLEYCRLEPWNWNPSPTSFQLWNLRQIPQRQFPPL